MDAAAPDLTSLLARAEAGDVTTALTDHECQAAARLALHSGRPRLALRWGDADPLTHAAALLRLGDAATALEVLGTLPQTARSAVLRARAHWQLADGSAQGATLQALALARREGDGAAVVAAATLRGEQLLPDPYAALRTLAEGLKVAEQTGQAADAHLLAVLAHAQRRLGGPKGARTATKALERSAPRSPARVLALLALDRAQEAHAEAADGELAAVWWRGFLSDQFPVTPSGTKRTAADG
ncbi:hypothetical protein [Deinococcus aerophilus]|uniref:Uncharacterized protein n=1 Tax=Deinococcus aerophilus TaxID=522488 RepID=A0ABQ2GN58_9DEIO|nr:hypothetical protein [Deinococcus aerophilus]GGM04728.1 hypothetical protein GCM10010841_11450 [Deinococcus aerophilus]